MLIHGRKWQLLLMLPGLIAAASLSEAGEPVPAGIGELLTQSEVLQSTQYVALRTKVLDSLQFSNQVVTLDERVLRSWRQQVIVTAWRCWLTNRAECDALWNYTPPSDLWRFHNPHPYLERATFDRFEAAGKTGIAIAMEVMLKKEEPGNAGSWKDLQEKPTQVGIRALARLICENKPCFAPETLFEYASANPNRGVSGYLKQSGWSTDQLFHDAFASMTNSVQLKNLVLLVGELRCTNALPDVGDALLRLKRVYSEPGGYWHYQAQDEIAGISITRMYSTWLGVPLPGSDVLGGQKSFAERIDAARSWWATNRQSFPTSLPSLPSKANADH